MQLTHKYRGLIQEALSKNWGSFKHIKNNPFIDNKIHPTGYSHSIKTVIFLVIMRVFRYYTHVYYSNYP